VRPPRFWRTLHPWTKHGLHILGLVVLTSVSVTVAVVPLVEGGHRWRAALLVAGVALALRMAKDNGINLAALRRRPDYARNENAEPRN
jgi:hypothetical protein